MREEVRSENRLGVSNKAEIPERQSVVGVELGLKLHQEEGKDRRSQKQHNDRLPSLCSNQIDGNGGGNGGDNRRPTFSELDTLYLSSSGVCDVSTPADSTVAGNGVSAPSAVRSCLLQPFDMSCLPAAYPFFKSPGGGGGGMATAPATTLGFFPFTAAQWKELQRQAMIYKYMVASLPVPPDLLFPINANISDHPSTSASPWGKMGMFDLRWESQSKDAEPGRCKRTDGKKWRCSRDVAPNQKYCERHLNRGRPRSRKPVEVRADFSINHHPDKISSAKKTRLGDDAQISSINLAGLRTDINGSISDKAQFHRNHESKASSFEHMVSAQGASVAATAQQWQQLGLRNMGLAADASVFGPHFQDEPLNSNSLVNFNSKQPSSDDQNCCLFANSATPKGFIDALSNHDDGAGNKSSVPSNENVYPSSLALSMAGRNPIDEEMCQIQMGLGDIYSDCSSGDGLKHQVPDWLGPPSWVPSNPGGPLAEVLQPRSATAVTNLATHPSCPDARNGDLVTPPATAVSSPSGVLQRSLASFSDSSGNNSPLYHTTKAKPEIPFQRLS